MTKVMLFQTVKKVGATCGRPAVKCCGFDETAGKNAGLSAGRLITAPTIFLLVLFFNTLNSMTKVMLFFSVFRKRCPAARLFAHNFHTAGKLTPKPIDIAKNMEKMIEKCLQIL